MTDGSTDCSFFKRGGIKCFILPVGNDCERFLSKASNAYGSDRMAIDLVNLEAQLFLNVNKSLWDEKLVHKMFWRTNIETKKTRNNGILFCIIS
jgi:hypothetical protein